MPITLDNTVEIKVHTHNVLKRIAREIAAVLTEAKAWQNNVKEITRNTETNCGVS